MWTSKVYLIPWRHFKGLHRLQTRWQRPLGHVTIICTIWLYVYFFYSEQMRHMVETFSLWSVILISIVQPDFDIYLGHVAVFQKCLCFSRLDWRCWEFETSTEWSCYCGWEEMDGGTEQIVGRMKYFWPSLSQSQMAMTQDFPMSTTERWEKRPVSGNELTLSVS